MGKYDDLLDEDELNSRDAAKRTLAGASLSDPETAAKALKLQRTTGVPAEVAARNLPEVQRLERTNRYEKLIDEDPLLAARLAKPEFAAVSHDDVPALSQITKGLRSFLAGGSESINRPYNSVVTSAEFSGNVKRLMAENPALDVDSARSLALVSTTVENVAPLAGKMRGSTPTFGNIVSGLADAAARAPQKFDAGLSYIAADVLGLDQRQNRARLANLETREASNTPEFETTTGEGLFAGGVSTIQNAPGIALSVLTGSPAPALALGGAQASVPAYPKYKERGATAPVAALASLGEGAVEVITEFLPMKTLLSAFGKSGSGAAMQFFKSQLQEQWTEQVATIAQDAIDTAVANPDKTWGQYLAERPEAAYKTFLATLVQTGAVTIAHTAAQKIMSAPYIAQQASAEADASVQKMQQLLDLASGSKLMQRDPQSLGAFIQDAADSDNGIPSALYVDANTLVETLQQSGMTMEQFAQAVPSVSAQLADALATGDTIELPIGELTANLASTGIEGVLLQHLRTSPDALSQAEAKLATEQARKELAQQAQAAVAQSEQADALQASSQAVKDVILNQLTTAKRFTNDVNDAYASLVRDFYTVTSQRLGMTPEALYQSYPLKVVAASTAPRTETLDAQGLDQTGRSQRAADRIPGFATRVEASPPDRSVAGQQTLELVHPAGPNDTTIRAEADGKEIGYLDLAVSEDGKKAVVREIVVAQGYQRQGVATALHEAAKAQGYEVERSPYETEEGAAFSDSLEQSPVSRVTTMTAAISKLLKNLTPAEQKKITDKTAAKVLAAIADLPSSTEMAAVAYAGRAKRGWYQESAQALSAVFQGDAPRFAALLAALSPQVSVESNLLNALNTWKNWIAAGRPTDQEAIIDVMSKSVQGGKGRGSVLDAWINNSVRALTDDNPGGKDVLLSGPKVNSFFLNLVGVTDEVTNDAWMSNYALVEQTIFKGRMNVLGTDPGKGAGYLAMNAVVRDAAAKLSKLTGETWTPSEVQETVWSWAKTLYELGASATEDRTMTQIVEEGSLTDDLINSTPDFSSLFYNGAYETILKDAGYGDQLESLQSSKRADAEKFDEGRESEVKTIPFAESAQLRYELRAAKRLEELYNRGREPRVANDIAEGVDNEVFYQSPAGGQQTATPVLSNGAGVRGSAVGVDDSPGQNSGADTPLAGLPATVTVDGQQVTFGPFAPARAAARAYAAAAGLPYNPPRTYEKVDPERAKRIAQAFDEMEHNPEDPAVKEAYEALAKETLAQWEAIKATGLTVEFMMGGDSYGNPRNAILDVVNNNHLWVYPTDAGFGGVTLNVGLNVNDGTTITDADVQAALAAYGVEATDISVQQSGTEPTFVARLSRALTPEEATAVSAALRQEAIAQSNGATGGLYGPNAAAWGEFNPEFFLVPEGGTAAAAASPLLALVPGETISGQPVRVNDIFRIVHDYFGHIAEGVGFRADGEENAWRQHYAMFSPKARAALATETRGQNSWVNFGPYAESNKTASGADTQYAPQKIGLLPDWAVNGGATDGSFKSLTGYHFSTRPRATLESSTHGQGLKDANREDFTNADDERTRERIYFYVDKGTDVIPLFGLGSHAHRAELNNVYDMNADTEGFRKGASLEKFESSILDAGYDGYLDRRLGAQPGVVVMLGKRSVTPEYLGTTSRIPTGAKPGATTAGEQPARPYKRGLLSREANALDMAAITAAAPSAKLRGGIFQVDQAEFAAAQQAAAAQGVELPAADTLNQPARGTFSPSQLQITLLQNADLSTFLHETGHFFLEVLADISAQSGAPVQVQQDMAEVLKWFGVADGDTWRGMSLEQQRPYHEQFARGFEAYLFEGKAPNIEMRGVFQRFRDWMKNVYQSLASLDVQLTDEVRGVFDRLLATDEQIASTEQQRAFAPMFQDAQAAGMTPDEWDAYQRQGATATATAADELQTRSLKDMRWLTNARGRALKALQQDAKAKRKEVEAEVRAEVQQMPVYAVQRWMKGKGLPDGSPAEGAKLSMDALKEAYGDGPAAPWRYLATNLVSTNPELSMMPDDIAEMFGFTSGDALVRELLNADSEAVMIEGMTDQRMLERYGDLATPEAQARAAEEAVHNEARSKFVATELRALQKATNVREKTAAGGTINVMLQAAKEYAANIISRKIIKEVKPYLHTAAEARAAKQAEKALAAGDLVAAATAKRNQLLNNATAKEALEALAEIEKAKEFFRKVMSGKDDVVGKTRDMDVVNAARAVIAQYGIGSTRGKTALEYMDLVQKNDPMLYDVLKAPVDAAIVNAKPFDQMTVEEMRGLRDEIQAMWFLAKRTREMIVDGQAVDLETAAGALQERMNEIGVPDNMPGDTSAVTPSEKRLALLRTIKAAAVRVESWAGAKDGDAPIGPFRKYIWQVVKEAADSYRADRAVYLKKYRTLLEAMKPVMKRELIEAPELGYTFGKGKGGVGMSELLHALIHTGNASNKRKLLVGRKWATLDADGNMDTSKWDAFIDRMVAEGKITKQSYDFAQAVWDMLEETKPLAQKAHRDVFGKYFAEVTADAFVTPFGTYRGGYAPAIADPEIVQDANIRALAEAENENMSFAFPATNKGFTKGRVEYNRPLKLDLRSIGQHMDKVLLFSHMEQPVRDVRRLLSSKGVSYALGRIDPPAIASIITPWLNRSARQQVETPIVGDGGASRWFSTMRNNAGMAAMFANVANTVQQLAGFSLASVKVHPKYLLGAMASYANAPRETAQTVSDASQYMASRMDNEASAMNAAINDILLDPNIYEQGKAWMQRHAYFLQSAVDNVMSPIIWIGARNQALEQGLSEADAIRMGDSAVRETQGTTQPEDVSRIETGNAFARLFTQFVSYFNMQANLLGGEFAKIQHAGGLRKGAGRALYVVTFGFLVNAWAAEAIMQAFKGGPDDEDKDGEYLDDWLWQVFGMAPVRSATAMVPVAGQMVMGAINAGNSKPYDDRLATSPAISMIESTIKAPYSLYKAMVDDGKKQKAVKDVATAISMATGVPVSGIARPLGYLAGVQAGEIAPTDGLDAVRGIATGAASPESKQ